MSANKKRAAWARFFVYAVADYALRSNNTPASM
ncbi:hypothetical protein VME0621_04959 [Vibrio mediterranei]|nr:hypothetical protein VME0621_04959 [Vibrio mediterranei]